MKTTTLKLGDLGTNCYVVATKQKNCVVIDPAADAERLEEFFVREGLTPQKILITHGHYDHIGGVYGLMKRYPELTLAVGERDAFMLEDPAGNLSKSWSGPAEYFRDLPVHTKLCEGDKIVLDELEFDVIACPGHTPGGVSYVCGDCVFSGDTLFKNTIGRVDLPGGSYDDIVDSIKKLYALEGDRTVFPGHGEPTTLETERANNPYVRTKDE